MEIVATEQTTTAILLNISNYVWFIACFIMRLKKTKKHLAAEALFQRQNVLESNNSHLSGKII